MKEVLGEDLDVRSTLGVAARGNELDQAESDSHLNQLLLRLLVGAPLVIVQVELGVEEVGAERLLESSSQLRDHAGDFLSVVFERFFVEVLVQLVEKVRNCYELASVVTVVNAVAKHSKDVIRAEAGVNTH